MYSQAESTIRYHHPSSLQSRPSRPLMKGKDGKFYPRNPITDYISRFADGFSGYLDCGSAAHLFRACPEKNSREAKQELSKT